MSLTYPSAIYSLLRPCWTFWMSIDFCGVCLLLLLLCFYLCDTVLLIFETHSLLFCRFYISCNRQGRPFPLIVFTLMNGSLGCSIGSEERETVAMHGQAISLVMVTIVTHRQPTFQHSHRAVMKWTCYTTCTPCARLDYCSDATHHPCPYDLSCWITAFMQLTTLAPLPLPLQLVLVDYCFEATHHPCPHDLSGWSTSNTQTFSQNRAINHPFLFFCKNLILVLVFYLFIYFCIYGYIILTNDEQYVCDELDVMDCMIDLWLIDWFYSIYQHYIQYVQYFFYYYYFFSVTPRSWWDSDCGLRFQAHSQYSNMYSIILFDNQ